MTAPSRRWFRFSLRTLFVVVTVFACWLGWNVRQVQQRRSLLQRVEAMGGEQDYAYAGGSRHRLPIFDYNIPWLRKMLGDEPVGILRLPEGMTNESVKAVEDAFPEALIVDHDGF